MRWVGLIVLGIGCGRIGFDPAVSADATTTSPDAFTVVGPCPYGPTAPDPITISGTTVDVATLSSEPGVSVEASLSVGGPAIAETTSDTGVLAGRSRRA